MRNDSHWMQHFSIQTNDVGESDICIEMLKRGGWNVKRKNWFIETSAHWREG